MLQRIINTLVLVMFFIAAGYGSYMVWDKRAHPPSRTMPNVRASFNSEITAPQIDPSAFIHPSASVIGNVTIGSRVFVAPMASVRGDEGQPIFIGNGSNIQDGVVLHALETEEEGNPIDTNLVTVDDKKYGVHVGDHVSLAHQAQIHGPARVGNNTFVGMQALVFRAEVGDDCVIEPGAKILGGVKIANHHFVPAGMVVSRQEQANQLPEITESYPLKDLNKGVLHVNTQLADGYRGGGEKSGEKE